MDIRDEHALQIVKNVYGGSIKLRSGANALRYRLHHKSGFLKLINDVNGQIRNSNRLVQLNKICHKYDLTLIYPEKLTFDNGWLSGFTDAEGCFTVSIKNTSGFAIRFILSQKHEENLTFFSKLILLFQTGIIENHYHHNNYSYVVSGLKNCSKLLESNYFEKFNLKTNKKSSYLLWKDLFFKLLNKGLNKIKT